MTYNKLDISKSIFNFQSALHANGQTLQSFIWDHYINKWLSDDLFNAMSIRTTIIHAMHSFLVNKGLFNLEKVSISPVTDPLSHDVEYTPTISYKGHEYTTTHSMIYNKLLACINPSIKGIFVDSPNIRLEIQSPDGLHRNKYLVDFSQMDIEIRRENAISFTDYLYNRFFVESILRDDFDKAICFFEELIVNILSEVDLKNQDNLKALGIQLHIPEIPFPRFRKDDAVTRYGVCNLEKCIGEQCTSQFFWITGLLRENYDLVYPYLLPNNQKIVKDTISSDMIYNYDLCAYSIESDTGTKGQAFEVLSGGLREWLYDPIVERLIDNNIITTRPQLVNGIISNIDMLDGYGPFLFTVAQHDSNNVPLFPSTFGGGIGIERLLFSLLNGPKIKSIDQVTCFGKNPDSHPLYLF